MPVGTWLAIFFGLLDAILLIYQWKEKTRIKAKEECWNKDVQSIVNIAAEMRRGVDNGDIANARELLGGIKAIGAFANGMHAGLKEELKIRD